MTVTIGIDPGATGAIAFVSDQGWLLDVVDMPYLDGHVIAPAVAEILRCGTRHHHPSTVRAHVERAQSMPRGGVASMFRYGTGYGVLLGTLGALGISTETVPPAKWKKALGLSKDKAACRRRASELWPLHHERFARAKDDGRAEAALIALYGHQLADIPTA